MAISTASLVFLAVISYAYMRRQWLQSLRQQSLIKSSEFIANSQDFDNAMAGSLALVQEVELVSRGYRMYAFPNSLLVIANIFEVAPPFLQSRGWKITNKQDDVHDSGRDFGIALRASFLDTIKPARF